MMGELEEKSLWYEYKKEVWPKQTNRSAVVHNVMRVLRSIHNSGKLGYISIPITTGKLFYDKALSLPCVPRHIIAEILNEERKADEFPEIMQIKKEVINENYRRGFAYVKECADKREIPILYPADLFPRLFPKEDKWNQSDFQALWLSIISEKVTELLPYKDWEYSNGGVEEFTHVMQLKLGIPSDKDLIFYNTKEGEKNERRRMKNIKVYDHEGKSISLNRGYSMVEKAVEWIKKNNIQPKKLEKCLELLDWTGNMIEKGFYQ